MIEKLKNIYKSFYSRLGVDEQDSQAYADESVLRMLILFTDKLMKSKLDEVQIKAKQDEFEDLFLIGNYEAINSDIQAMMDESSTKLLFECFLDIIADVVNELKKGRVVDDKKLAELGASLKTDIENMVAVSKLGNAESNQGSLQALAN